jgi:hypothetical protein
VLSGSDARIQYVDYVDNAGVPLFEQACQHDLEGIVAKQKHAPYVTDREQSTGSRSGILTIHNGQDARNCLNANAAESPLRDGIRVLWHARSWSTSMSKRVSSFYEEQVCS